MAYTQQPVKGFLGGTAVIVAWVVVLIGLAVFYAWFSETIWALLLSVGLIIGIPIWALLNVGRD